MPQSFSEVATENASLNLKKLCRHFSHKVETHYNERSGQIHFPFGGIAALEAVEGRLLMIAQAGDAEHLDKTEQIISDHLLRFASKESLSVRWQRQS